MTRRRLPSSSAPPFNLGPLSEEEWLRYYEEVLASVAPTASATDRAPSAAHAPTAVVSSRAAAVGEGEES